MDTNTINNATMTKQDYRREILRKYSAVLKSCRNLVTQDDIRQVRQAFDIALKNATEDTKLDYEEIIRILDTTLIITQEIGLGRTSIICAMVHKTVEKDILPLARLYGHFCEKQIQDFPLSLASPAENVIIRQMTSGDNIIAVIVNKNSSETELEFDGPIPDNARLLYGTAMPEGSRITLGPEECIVMTYRK